jgi:hypothetical protein
MTVHEIIEVAVLFFTLSALFVLCVLSLFASSIRSWLATRQADKDGYEDMQTGVKEPGSGGRFAMPARELLQKQLDSIVRSWLATRQVDKDSKELSDAEFFSKYWNHWMEG